MAPARKKRKYKDKKRTFKPDWEGEFAFTDNGGKPLCLVCHDSLSHYKATNMKRHHEKDIATFLITIHLSQH